MSFFSPQLHLLQQHEPFFEYSTPQGPLCLACWLHSLGDAAELDSRKVFVIRDFMRQFGPQGPEGGAPLQQLLGRHANSLVAGLLAALTASQDLGLAGAVGEAALGMCACAPDYLPELFTERVLQLLLELPWPPPSAPALGLDPTSTTTTTTPASLAPPAVAAAAAAVAASLALLQDLVASYPAAARLCAGALARSEPLAALLCEGLGCGLEAAVVPLLHIFSDLACSSQAAAAATADGGCCCLAPPLVSALFLRLLQLMPQLRAQDLKALVLSTLLSLVGTGYAVEQMSTRQQQQPHERPVGPAVPLGALYSTTQLSLSQSLHMQHASQHQHSQELQSQQHERQQQSLALGAAIIMCGLKSVLLDSDPAMQLLGCQLLAAVAARAPAALLQQLVAADACEHLFEVLRGTLASCSMRASMLDASGGGGGGRLTATQRPHTATAGGMAVAAAVADATAAAEALQVACVASLQHLATQGAAFMEHLHFGLDTLADLLQHSTTCCHTPLQAAVLLLLAEVTGPTNPSSLLLPPASLARLAAAAVAVLPLVDAAEAAAAGGCDGGGGRPGRTPQLLQPPPELQDSYVLACRVLTHLCVKWCLPGASGSRGPSTTIPTTTSTTTSPAALLQPHIVTGAHRALMALSILGTAALLSGFLAAGGQLLQAAVQLLGSSASALLHQQQQQPQQQLQRGHSQPGTASGAPAAAAAARGGAGSAVAKDKGATKQQQQQQQQQSQQQQRRRLKKQPAAAPGGTASSSRRPLPFLQQRQQQASDAAQGMQDDLLCLFEAALLHLLPAAARAWEALGCGEEGSGGSTGSTAAWSLQHQPEPHEQQQQLAEAARLFGVVAAALLALYEAGGALPELAPFLPSFSAQLLGPGRRWASRCLDLLALLQPCGPPGGGGGGAAAGAAAAPGAATAAAMAWQVLLAAAMRLQGGEFFAPGSMPNIAALASSLASRVGSRLQLLELLCASSSSNPAAPQHQQRHRGSTQASSAAGTTAAQAAGRSGSGGSSSGGDIRRFCGVSELHRAALCVVAAALHCGDGAWCLADVATALDAVVGQAGPGVLSQPELLLSIARLYGALEGEVAADAAAQQQQQVQAMQCEDALAPPWLDQQQQQLGLLPLPSALISALQRLGPGLPPLQPRDGVAAWVMAKAAALPATAALLLQRWMAALLAAPPPEASDAAGAGTAGAAPAPNLNQQTQQQQQQAEVASALLALLQQQPAALPVAMQLAQQCYERQPQQPHQLAAWLSVFVSLLHTSSSGSGLAAGTGTDTDTNAAGVGSSGGCHRVLHELLLCSHGTDSTGQHGAGAAAAAAGQLLMPEQAGGGILQLLRRAVLSSAASPDGRMAGSSGTGDRAGCYVLLACTQCVLGIAAAVASGAAAASSSTDTLCGAAQAGREQQQQLLLLQQAHQVLRLVCSRVCTQRPPSHAPTLSLLAAAGSAAAALLHAGIVTGSSVLLQQLAHSSSEVHRTMQLLADAALGADSQPHQPQGQNGPAGVLSAQEQALEQAMVLLLQSCGLLGGGGHIGSNTGQTAQQQQQPCRVLAVAVPDACGMMVSVLAWQQGLMLMRVGGALPAGLITPGSEPGWRGSSMPAGPSAGIGSTAPPSSPQQQGPTVCGLSLLQLLLLAQAQGPGLLSLLLLEAASLALKQQDQKQEGRSARLPWLQMLTVLQNTATAAAAPAMCSSRYRLAAVGCLASMYAAAAVDRSADSSGGSTSGSGGGGMVVCPAAVADSPWNAAVLAAAVERLCHGAVALQGAANSVTAGPAVAGMGDLDDCPRTSGAAAAGTTWLLDAEVREHCQLWCADAQLLCSLLQCVAASRAAAAAAAAGAAPAGAGAAAGGKPPAGSAATQQVGALLGPWLEQQQLLGFLCWASSQAAYCCWDFDEQAREGGALPLRLQGFQRPQSPAGQLAATAAACCAALQLSEVSLLLLQALLEAGALTPHLARLKQQLQQQVWALAEAHQQRQQRQQQGPARLSGCSGGGVTVGGVQAQLAAAGALQVLLGRLEGGGGPVGLLQGAGAHMLAGGGGLGGSGAAAVAAHTVGHMQQLLQRIEALAAQR